MAERRWWPSLVIAIPIAVGLAIAFALSTVLPDTKQHRLCDGYVHALLTTTDLVEVQRMVFLVNYLDCNLTRRAPEP